MVIEISGISMILGFDNNRLSVLVDSTFVQDCILLRHRFNNVDYTYNYISVLKQTAFLCNMVMSFIISISVHDLQPKEDSAGKSAAQLK